jgi:hypothetical protein
MEYQDLNLRPQSEDLPIILSMPVESTHRGLKIAAAGVIVIAVAAGGYFVYKNRPVSAPASAPAVAAPAAAQPADAATPLGAEVAPIDLPPLDQSDDVVRTLVGELSSHPTVAAWLATDNLIRNFTVVVANIAAGESAVRQVPALKPRGGFQVEERGEDLVVNSRSYSRYLPLATAATSINAEGAAKLYSSLKPRIEEAYAELGQTNTFDQTLERAIVLLLRTPVPNGRVSVEPNGVNYRFADPALEKLTPSQKLLIRFGPDNQRAVQTSLRNIALALGIPGERLPQ